MFDPESRYYELDTAYLLVRNSDGTTQRIAYKRRRFLPPADEMTTLVEHVVQDGDRPDNITALYLGEPTQFWRVMDANNVLHPQELTDEVGRRIKIAMPKM